MNEDYELRSSASRKLTLFERRKMQRALAAGESTRAQIARDLGVSTSYVSQFAKRYAQEIDEIRRALTDEFAGLWIASKENRILAYQTEYTMALGHTKRDHHEWIKARAGILHTVAEELGQLPPRATVTVTPVTHIIVGVDPEALK